MRSLRRLGKLRLRVLALPARLLTSMLRYRNKAGVVVAMASAGPLVGFNKRGSNKIADCTDCLLQKRATMRQPMQSAISYRTSWFPYTMRHGKGFSARDSPSRSARARVSSYLQAQPRSAKCRESHLHQHAPMRSRPKNHTSCQSVLSRQQGKRRPRTQPPLTSAVAGSNTDDAWSSKLPHLTRSTRNADIYAKVRVMPVSRAAKPSLTSYCGIGTIGLSMATQAGMIYRNRVSKMPVIGANRNAVTAS